MAAAQDPFYVVKDELTAKVHTIQKRLQTFKRLLETTDTATNQDFKDSKKALGRDLKAAEKQLKDLTLTVEFVQKDRAQFAHIDDYDLQQRTTYIAETKQALGEIKAYYSGDDVKRKLADDMRKDIMKQPTSNLGATSSDAMENTHFIQGQQAQQRMIMEQQDEDLEELGYAVDRVNDMAVGINTELKTQNRMLKDLESDLDEATEKMNFVMGKLAKLLKTKDTCQIWTVIILFFIVLLLIFLLIYT
uniref:t-SNARE coiled-coil homology domain-containing protein n=1 Tax=Rhizochromulina marina TaxID=1034831 RepID=A0A7S2S2M2_9STRA